MLTGSSFFLLQPRMILDSFMVPNDKMTFCLILQVDKGDSINK